MAPTVARPRPIPPVSRSREASTLKKWCEHRFLRFRDAEAGSGRVERAVSVVRSDLQAPARRTNAFSTRLLTRRRSPRGHPLEGDGCNRDQGHLVPEIAFIIDDPLHQQTKIRPLPLAAAGPIPDEVERRRDLGFHLVDIGAHLVAEPRGPAPVAGLAAAGSRTGACGCRAIYLHDGR
jgi:hypothetical protein